MKREGEQIPLIGLARVGDHMHFGLQAQSGSKVELHLLDRRQKTVDLIKVEEHPYHLGYFCTELDKNKWKNTEFQVLVDDKPTIYPQAKVVRERFGQSHCFGERRSVEELLYGWAADRCPLGWESDRPITGQTVDYHADGLHAEGIHADGCHTADCHVVGYHAYKLHVRGFTKSLGKRGGTFAALQTKIEYLRELGVSHLISFPIYDFTEELPTQRRAGMPLSLPGLPCSLDSAAANSAADEDDHRVQYWGYAAGYYYAVKPTYAACDDPAYELRQLIMVLHKAGIAFVPEFYFPDELPYAQILAILRYWVTAFHLDGVRILGNIDGRAILQDPIIGAGLCLFEETAAYHNEGEGLRLLSAADGQLIKAAVKGDAGCMYDLSRLFIPARKRWSVISRHDGFSLADTWMYQDRHNLANGEFGRDGRENEPSWNVGTEGPSRSRKVNRLRLQLAKNTLALQFLGGALPMTLAGDEYLHSHEGNNNPYCLDEALNYQKWRHTKAEKEFYHFYRQLVELCLSQPLLQGGGREHGKTVRLLGYPTLSFHGLQPWKQAFGESDRHLAVLLCREYDGDQGAMEVDAFYLMINFHWLKQEFFLPTLPDTYLWQPVFDTANEDSFALCGEQEEQPVKSVTLIGRSIRLYRCRKKAVKKQCKSSRKAEAGKS